MKRILTLTALALAASIAFVQAADPITPDQVAKLQSLIKPASGEEKWQEIPWQVSLWKARQMAAAEGKPILLWEMDGHPLGCT
jgi:hypothetical protein